MSKPKKAVIFFVFSLLLFVLSAFLINSIDTNPDTLFYYALNAFFVSLTVFALPSCFFMLQGIFTKNGNTPDFSLLVPSPLSLLISSMLAPLVFLLGTVLSSLFSSKTSGNSKGNAFLRDTGMPIVVFLYSNQQA